MKWLATNEPNVVRKNIKNIIEYGRIDDLYCLIDTPVEKDIFKFISHQIAEDIKAWQK